MRARLDIIYPNRYSLDMAATSDRGTTVRLRIPFTSGQRAGSKETNGGE
jgi:hypothetical protein